MLDVPPTLLVVLLALATYRVTRLIVADAWPPTERLRDWVEDRTGPESGWSYLVHCPWCMSPYVAALCVLLTAVSVDGGVPAPALVIAACSALTGLIASIEPE